MTADIVAKDIKTVFVRGVPFDYDEKALEEVFSDVGPIKSCFLVKLKGQEKHRGFGFVQFSLPEDAERAAQSLNGSQLAGRKLLVELADKRAPLETRKRKGGANADDSQQQETTVTQQKRRQQCASAAVLQNSSGEPLATDSSHQDHAKTTEAAARMKKGVKPKPSVTGAAVEVASAAVSAQDPPAASEDPAAAVGRKKHVKSISDVPSTKHRLLRAIAIGNLTTAVAPVAIAMALKLGTVEEVVSPAPEELIAKSKLRADGCTGEVAIIYYNTVKDALEAVTKLHGRRISPPKASSNQKGKQNKKGQKGSKGVELEATATTQDTEGTGSVPEAVPAAAPAVTLWCRQVSGEGAHIKKFRVIVRNLPFKITEKAVRAAVEKAAGFVWEFTLPRGPDGRLKGFAFASFTCLAHAQKAIQNLNGKPIEGRVVAVDWAVEKDKYELAQKAGPGVEGKPVKDADADEESEGDDEEDGAVDDQVQDPEGERQMLRKVLGSVMEEEEEGEEEDGGGDKEEEIDEEAGASKSKPGSRKATEAAKMTQDNAALMLKPRLTELEIQSRKDPEYLGRTVFIRGLSLDVTQIELQARMEVYGPVQMCRVVMDKASGKPKGTAFIEFKTGADAAKAAAACDRGRKGIGPGITLSGRQLDVDMAVNQDDARAISAGRANGKSSQEGKDKRNLYLAKEGIITEGSAAWDSLSDADKEKRKRAAQEMKQKLRSPNFMLSATRLSIRNLPYSVDETQLRLLAAAAVTERAKNEKPRIMSVKLLREADKLGPDGKPRSKGMGFVDFADHAHAVAALRQLNNNPKPFGANRRPIVEFSVENVKVLKKLEEIQTKKAASKAAAKAQKKDKQKKKKAEGVLAAKDSQIARKEGSNRALAVNGSKTQQLTLEAADSAVAAKAQKAGSKRKQHKDKESNVDTASAAELHSVKRLPKRQKTQADGLHTAGLVADTTSLPNFTTDSKGKGAESASAEKVQPDPQENPSTSQQALSKAQQKKEQLKKMREKQKKQRLRRKEAAKAVAVHSEVGGPATAAKVKKAHGMSEVAQSAQALASSGNGMVGSAARKPQGSTQRGKRMVEENKSQTAPAGSGGNGNKGLNASQKSGGLGGVGSSGKGRVDAAIDQLAERSLVEEPGRANRRRSRSKDTDRLDTLVEDFKAKYFGGSASSKTQAKNKQGQGSEGLRRWFE
ncbi:hypothetical protein CEUSTIGMA_g4701.t1 [Chlamydomonas eustigma]|uniref:RRM domain-containing protein n=1 Tax=Chlamydomonas eustigma TaxID=1157962 RepID=A0A250X2H2_9CHLO|nr:hypothetical protein CEUSTIGMA_g4701.t1 [Chlamydomonas eustigma]|eukprot:GAX77255.1 hypothetical protein CEUSTIGMA_g4701.t1 [Chlamydomonas eustigma]